VIRTAQEIPQTSPEEGNKRVGSILVVDDDTSVLDVLSEMLRLEGHDVTTAENGKDAVHWVVNQGFDLVITDLIMPEKEGLETITDIRRQSSEMPIIAISGGGRVGPNDYLETARFIGANATLAKPFAREELISTVDSLLG
jgi:DNA-binding response OmpR family regulator